MSLQFNFQPKGIQHIGLEYVVHMEFSNLLGDSVTEYT